MTAPSAFPAARILPAIWVVSLILPRALRHK